MVDPDFARAEYGDSIAVRSSSPAYVGWARCNVGVAAGLAMVDMDVVDDDVGDVLEGYAPVSDYVNVRSSAIDGLEAVDYELVFELDGHVRREDDPERLGLYNGMPESSRDRVSRVSIGGVGYHVDLTSFASHGVVAEPDSTVS